MVGKGDILHKEHISIIHIHELNTTDTFIPCINNKEFPPFQLVSKTL
jgi:hypothetical protein